MFGYVTIAAGALTQEQRERYRAYYCGLCHALKRRYGALGRMTLSYDMTFLYLLLNSLYEPDETQGTARCLPHPFRPHVYIQSELCDYCCDMNLALAYHKCLDDWHDDRSLSGRAEAALLADAYARVAAAYPETCGEIERCLAAISRLEHEGASSPDAAANRFGALLGEVFAWRDDFWAAGLRSLGAKLGKLVYVMDAALDREDDRASGSYNPLVALDAQPQDVREDLELLAADAAAAFEKLPLERDVRVLRSVLYAGVWQKYYAKEAKEAKKAKKAGQPGQAKEPTHVQEEHQEAYRG